MLIFAVIGMVGFFSLLVSALFGGDHDHRFEAGQARNSASLLLFWVVCGPFVFAQAALWQTYSDAGNRAYRHGQYAEAEKFYIAALREAEKFGERDLRLAKSLNNLAEAYRAGADFAQAERLHRRSLAIKEKIMEPDDPAIAISLSNLAALCDDQGKYIEAESLFKRSLAIREKEPGSGDASVAQSLNGLAEVYRHQGKYADARPL